MINILITGINGGIGKQLAHKFKEKQIDTNIYGIDIHKNIDADIHFCNYYSLDLSKNNFSKKLNSTELINIKFDVIINNAALQLIGNFNEFSDEAINNIFNVNIISIIKLIKNIKLNNFSNIINIGSIHSIQTKPGFSLYSSTKGALESLTRSLSIELAPKTRVNMIRPAAIETPMLKDGLSKSNYNNIKKYHPVKNIGNPTNIFKSCENIINNDFINGSIIDLDGGISNMLNDPEQNNY